MAVSAQDSGTPAPSPYVASPEFPAAEFPPGLDWLNVPAPLTMRGLGGKIVLLHFWSSGCVPCLHMLSVLSRLEAKYGGALVVIGVHSPKFPAEAEPEHLRQTMARYGLDYPVVNDSLRLAWLTFGVNTWPTLELIDPRGNILAMQPDETAFETLDQPIAGMVQYFDSTGELDHTPIPLALEPKPPDRPLSFPGAALADSTSNRLFVSDTGHNRLVAADLTSGEVLDVIGSGQRGFKDGRYSEAEFDRPQGMALDGATLYVADSGNHAIRAVDLNAQVVTTIAGTGAESEQQNAIGDPLTITLNTPWDVALNDGALFITMAGEQQIWGLLFSRDVIGPVAGVGLEGLRDGAFDAAQFAQPSGLYADNGRLYVTDSDSSSVRAADLSTRQVATLAGPLYNTLDTFGDVDGAAGVSRLQHPLDITGAPDGTLYIADTYNNRIKTLDPQSGEIRTLAVSGAAFDQPGGVSYANGKLYVADTDNQAIRVIDLAANTVSTITFANLDPPQTPP